MLRAFDGSRRPFAEFRRSRASALGFKRLSRLSTGDPDEWQALLDRVPLTFGSTLRMTREAMLTCSRAPNDWRASGACRRWTQNRTSGLYHSLSRDESA